MSDILFDNVTPVPARPKVAPLHGETEHPHVRVWRRQAELAQQEADRRGEEVLTLKSANQILQADLDIATIRIARLRAAAVKREVGAGTEDPPGDSISAISLVLLAALALALLFWQALR